MTFSLVVREPVDPDSEGTEYRFGVGMTSNNPGIGVFCPFASEHGAVAAQYQTHGHVGPQIRDALDDGLQAVDAVPAVAAASPIQEHLQIHALCRETRGYFGGDELNAFHDDSDLHYGERSGEHWSVAGNCLATTDTLDATAEAFEAADSDRTLAVRLLDALDAGDEAGGDGRDNDARSAVLLVVDPTAGIANEWYNDLRVGASETPLADLRAQYELAKSHHENAKSEWE